MADIVISDLFNRMKPYIYGLLEDFSTNQGESASFVHDLDGSLHTGTLDISKVPDALNRNGGTVTGNINALDGVLFDNVDISVFNTQFVTHAGLDATTAHGSVGVHDHTNAAEGGQIDHGSLLGLGDDDHLHYLHLTVALEIRKSFNVTGIEPKS